MSLLFKNIHGDKWTTERREEARKDGWDVTVFNGKARYYVVDANKFKHHDDLIDLIEKEVGIGGRGELPESTYGAAYLLNDTEIVLKETASAANAPLIDASKQDETIDAEARRLVYGDRESSYGPPTEDFARIGKIWEAVLGVPVSAKQVALCMAGVKISREVHKPKRDNLVDLIGYTLCAHRIETNT